MTLGLPPFGLCPVLSVACPALVMESTTNRYFYTITRTFQLCLLDSVALCPSLFPSCWCHDEFGDVLTETFGIIISYHIIAIELILTFYCLRWTHDNCLVCGHNFVLVTNDSCSESTLCPLIFTPLRLRQHLNRPIF